MITQLNIRIDKTLHTEAKMFCLQRNILLEDMVCNAITDYMQITEKGKPAKGKTGEKDNKKDSQKNNLID